MKKIQLLSLSLLFCSGLWSQQPLWHISLNAEQSLNENGIAQLETAWFVTGSDTIYRLHFDKGQTIGRKTTYDHDSIWSAGDSTYQQHADFLHSRRSLSVFYNKREVINSRFKKGRLISKIKKDYNPLGREVYKQTWVPERFTTFKEWPNGKKRTTSLSFKDSMMVAREIHADTNLTWTIKKKDTIKIGLMWKDYGKTIELREDWRYVNISTPEIAIQVSEKPERSDSTFRSRDKNAPLNAHYVKIEQQPYVLNTLHKTNGKSPREYEYYYFADRDTTQHTWIFYEPQPGLETSNNYTRIRQHLFLNQDSNFYKSIDYIYLENGELSHKILKRKWRRKKKIKNPKEEYREDHFPHSERRTEFDYEPFDYQTVIQILDLPSDVVTVNGKKLEHLIIAYLKLDENSTSSLNRNDWWYETLVLEVKTNGELIGLRQSPNSGLSASILNQKLKDYPLQLPNTLNTRLYYKRINGHKANLKLDYVLIPVKMRLRVQIR